MQLLFVCLQRISDNSQGVINFCLFCLFTKEVRRATIVTIKQFCPCQTPNTPENTHVTGNATDTAPPTTNYGTMDPQPQEMIN